MRNSLILAVLMLLAACATDHSRFTKSENCAADLEEGLPCK